VKSADWLGNRPHPLDAPTATEFAKLPTYYVMDLDADMARTVAPFMPTAEAIAACPWLPDRELAVYASEFARTGFQGALNWYRVRTSPAHQVELETFAGRAIDVPSLFVGGAQDWGVQQIPGGLDLMRTKACTDMRGSVLIEGAGHWVQQEQPDAVSDTLLRFMRAL
jgi:pimeloyl-ACP methyl ester carboxylesterase